MQQNSLATMQTILKGISSKGKTEGAIAQYLGVGTAELDLRKAAQNDQSALLTYVNIIDKTVREYAKQRRIDPDKNKLRILQDLFPNKEEFNRGMNSILSDVNRFRFAMESFRLGRGAGDLDKDFKTMVGGAEISMKRLAEQWKQTTDLLGEAVVDTHMLDAFNTMLENMHETLEKIKQLSLPTLGELNPFKPQETKPEHALGIGIQGLFGTMPSSVSEWLLKKFAPGAQLQQQQGGAQQNEQQQQAPGSPFGALVRPVIPSDPGSTTEATAKSQLQVMQELRELMRQQGGEGLGGGGAAAGVGTGGFGGSGSARGAHGSRAAILGGGPPLAAAPVGAERLKVARESYDFWRSSGYSHEAAMGMVAQEAGESGFAGAGARGDSGHSIGSFQWSPERRAAIMRGTGIDVTRAGHMDQLRASKWEQEHTEKAAGDAIKASKSLHEAVYRGVHEYERSKYQAQDIRKREGIGLQLQKQMGVGPQSSLDDQMDDLNALRRKASEPIRTKVAFDFDHADMQSARYRGGAEARRQFGKQIKLATSRSMTDTGVV